LKAFEQDTHGELGDWLADDGFVPVEKGKDELVERHADMLTLRHLFDPVIGCGGFKSGCRCRDG
jgi:hypothetical protein